MGSAEMTVLCRKQKKLSELISEGKKLLIAGNKDLAIDRLSDAAELG